MNGGGLGGGGGRGEARQGTLPPPRSYHRRWVISYMCAQPKWVACSRPGEWLIVVRASDLQLFARMACRALVSVASRRGG